MNTVFVIIVTYNGMAWIQECIDSLLSSNINISIIVVDNCSTDDTAHFIGKYYSDNVKLIELKSNVGFGKGNNVGISEAMKAGADYVFLLNQDAFVESNTIDELVAVANKNPEYGIISPIHSDGNGSKLDKIFNYYLCNSYSSGFISDFVLNNEKRPIYDLPMVNAAAWLLPRATIEVIGGFDPMFFLYGEDDNYCQRVIYNKLKIGIVPHTNIRHDCQYNNTKEHAVGSKKYYDVFLNRIKVMYGNVNLDKYKELGKLKLSFLKKCLKSLIMLRLHEARVNLKKWQLLTKLDIKTSVLLNRKKGVKYL